MPDIRAFRALRFDPEVVPDLARVVAPPYDVIGPAERAELAARDPHNMVAIDLPVDDGAADPDEKYRAAARTFAAWRSAGILRRDRRPSLYVCEQQYEIPGTAVRRSQWGFYGRLRLESFGPAAGVLPHERTLAAPREDRYKLLRATSANFSGIAVLYSDPGGGAAGLLARAVETPPTIDLAVDGARHRLWAVPDDGDTAPLVAGLREAAAREPLVIADGHHRYETSLRYRDERRLTNTGETDPAYDFTLALFLDAAAQPLLVLPTHRLVGLPAGGGGVLAALAAGGLFDVEPADRSALLAAFGPGAPGPGGRGRFGVWTRAGGAILAARRDAFAALLPPGGEALGRLDVTLLAAALERTWGIDRAATTSGGRVGYARDAAEAMAAVDAGEVGAALDGRAADAAFLLEATPVADVRAVARQGDVMPQKSTYFHPKPATGLVLNPLEW